MKEIKRIKKKQVAKQRQADSEKAITNMYIQMMALTQTVRALEKRIDEIHPKSDATEE